MIDIFLQTIIGQRLRTFALYIKESFSFTFLTLLFLIIGVVYIRNILDFVGAAMVYLSERALSLFYLLNIDEKYALGILLIYISLQIVVFKKLFRNSFQENFNDYLRNWSIPKDAEWAIIKDDDTPGRVLQVTKAAAPGILKEGRNWYDYEVTFQTKIIDDNFTILVRAREKSNAIMLQFKTNKLRPHLIVDGIFVVDDKNEQSLQIKIPEKKWIEVVVKVKGDYIDIFLEGSRISYRIPSGIITVLADRVHATMSMSELEGLGKEYSNVRESRESVGKDREVKLPVWRPYNFIFDFDIGTIGFRESGNENALFRKIKICRK